MKRRGFLLGLTAALLVTAGVAEARVHAPYRAHRIVPVPAALDGVGSFSTSVTGAYSFRKLKSTYGGAAMRLRRATGGTQDIAFLGGTSFTGAPWDQVQASTFCAATTCFLDTWYDQSGLARDLVQATAGSQLQLNFSCTGGRPCFQNTAVVTQSVASAAAYTPTAPLSMSAVSNRAVFGGGAAECIWFRGNNSNRLQTFDAPWYLAAAAAFTASPQPADAAWHTQQGVINGASSVLNIDGTETTGTVAVDTGSGGPYTILSNNATTTTCQFAEAIIWNAYALSPAERAFLTNNQRAYIGP